MNSLSLPLQWRSLIAFLLISITAACTPPKPIKLGYVGTLSGRNTDLGLSGRNGALLAVEQINATGGVLNRPLELLIKDDEQLAETAFRCIESLAEEKALAIIGPMTSAMAIAMIPQANRSGIVLLSPTATADELTGQDDYLFRLSSASSAQASLDADFQFRHEQRRRIAVILDTANKSFSEGYLEAFTKTFTSLGGAITVAERFDSRQALALTGLLHSALKNQPDALLIIANAADTAKLAQHARQNNPALPLLTSAWAGTEALLLLGGKSVEGMNVGQVFDRDSTRPAYQNFRTNYQARFGEQPSYGSTVAYDAVQIVAEALRRKSDKTQLKQTLLTQGPFPGTLQDISFDRFGDTHRPSRIAVVQEGKMRIIPWP